MAAVLTHSQSQKHFGLRPMDPMKDLRGVADLIEEAFASDLDRSGQSALRELRWLSYMGPILWWMVYLSPDHSDFLSGFVWEENKKIVGNITINRTAPGSKRWMISNLAVAKNYRQRGIARGLMYTALELVKEYNGTSVSLQVRADNTAAKKLYESLDFIPVSGTTYLSAQNVPIVEADEEISLPDGITLRSQNYSSADIRRAYDLASASIPIALQKEWPLRQRHFQLSDKERLNNYFRRLIGAGASARWIVEDGQRFIGLANIQPGFLREAHRIELIVHPDWRGSLEKPLVARALRYLWPWRKNGLMIKQPAEHVEAIQAYKACGVREEQTLIWMKLDM